METQLRQSAASLETFYASPLGDVAVRMTLRRLYALWPHLESCDVLGVGYTLPFLTPYRKTTHRTICALPEGQGLSTNPTRKGNASAVVMDAQMPFAPAIFDHVLLAHALEESPNPAAMLAEIYRLMKPEGRIVIIAANRGGMWARSDKTPFGAGRPFSARQLSSVLKEAGFEPLVRSGAVYGPPHTRFCGKRVSSAMEKFGETVWPGFSGLILVEAVKRLYAGRNGRVANRVKRPKFATPGALGVPGKIFNPDTKHSHND